MFSKKKNTSKLDQEQREFYDNARRRSLQKRRLFQHFVTFLIGAIFLIVLNEVIGYKKDFQPLGYDWFVWVVLLWAFIFLIHFFNVFIVNSFMGKEWEAKQMERLVRKQKERIAELEQNVKRDYPLPPKKDTSIKNTDPSEPDQPINS